MEIVWAGLGLIAGFFLWIVGVEPNWFSIRHKTLRLNQPLTAPLTILHLSDLHFDRRRFFLRRFFRHLAALDYDFVFVTGDLIDSRKGIRLCIEHLQMLQPKKGIYAVLGNHDYRNYPPFDELIKLFFKKNFSTPRRDTALLEKSLREAGIRLLKNEHLSLALGKGKEVDLVGLDDPVTGRANLEQAFSGIQDGAPRLVLTHSPAIFPSLARRGVDAAFAGHTHGGQVRIPGVGPFPLVYRLAKIIDSTNQYGFAGLVSRGVSAQPFARLRLFCRPEALLVRIEGTGCRS